jgi:hypothetical protein
MTMPEEQQDIVEEWPHSVEIGQTAKKEWYVKSLKVRFKEAGDPESIVGQLTALRAGIEDSLQLGMITGEARKAEEEEAPF